MNPQQNICPPKSSYILKETFPYLFVLKIPSCFQPHPLSNQGLAHWYSDSAMHLYFKSPLSPMYMWGIKEDGRNVKVGGAYTKQGY